MSDNDMAIERDIHSPAQVRPKSLGAEPIGLTPEELLQQHKHRGTFADIRGLLSKRERAQRREERAHEAENLFGADVERIARLDFAQSAVESSEVTTGFPHQNFPAPEHLLATYATKPDDGQRRGFKEDVRLFTEKSIKQTLGRLRDDIKTLYQDRGENQTTVTQEIEGLTEPVIRGKRRYFGRLGRDEQMGIIDNALDLRNGLLRGNMDHYMYYLSAYQEGAMLSDEQMTEIRERFANASEDEQVSIAAQTRRKALAAMDLTREANLYRLRGMEVQDGKNPKAADKEMEDLHAAYRAGTLPQKERLIQRILTRKATLSIPHLGEITHLREILESAAPEEPPIFTFDNFEGGDESRVLAEAARIETLVTFKIATEKRSISFGAITTKDMTEEVGKLALRYEDTGLSRAFERVTLLRTTVGEISKV